MKFGIDIPHNAANSFNLLFVLLISTIYSIVINRLHAGTSCCKVIKRLGQIRRCYMAKSEFPRFANECKINIKQIAVFLMASLYHSSGLSVHTGIKRNSPHPPPATSTCNISSRCIRHRTRSKPGVVTGTLSHLNKKTMFINCVLQGSG